MNILSLFDGSEISETAKFNVINNLQNHKKFNKIKDNKLLLAYDRLALVSV